MTWGAVVWRRRSSRVHVDTFGTLSRRDEVEEIRGPRHAEERAVWRTGKIETYAVQIVNKPNDLFVQEIWDAFFVLFLVEETDELIGKLG